MKTILIILSVFAVIALAAFLIQLILFVYEVIKSFMR